MVEPTLAEDIAYAISCMQDYRDALDVDTEKGKELWEDVSGRIERLFQFYYQLTGFDPNERR